MTDNDLERLLAQARQTAPAVSDEFMARVLQRALAEQPAVAGAVATATAVQTAPVAARVPALVQLQQRALAWGQRFAAGLGGAGVLAGLGTVALTGLWLGYADPVGLSESLVSYADAGVEMVPVDDLFLSEG